MRTPARLGVCISGGGSNLQAIIDACSGGVLSGIAQVAVVVSSRSDAYGLERARRHGIPTVVVAAVDPEGTQLGAALAAHGVDIVCLAGYMRLVPAPVVAAYQGRIVNIHPALLPRFGGPGMYGRRVHEAVIAADEKESGATVHGVDAVYDHGPILLQEKVPVLPGDSPESLAARVLAVEHRIYPRAIARLIQGGTP